MFACCSGFDIAGAVGVAVAIVDILVAVVLGVAAVVAVIVEAAKTMF